MSINSFRQNLQNRDDNDPLNQALVKLAEVSDPTLMLSKSAESFYQWQPWNPDTEITT